MKKIIYLICLVLLQFGCDSEEVLVINKPSIVNLIFPYENSLCNEGTNRTPTESTVLFEWQAGEYTDSYTLVLKNVSSGVQTVHQSDIKPELSITIQRASQYQWYIISNSNVVMETAKSETWIFYNSAEGVQSYTPFPADIKYPLMAQTISTTASTITLDWTGSDVDDDIVGYDVYFGTSNQPGLFISNLNDSILNDVPISSNTIYYWKIITKDSLGNSSDSGLYQFKIQ
ncbi:MAG: hypothetical protein ACI9SI_001389 [Polaribacter sp.]|jgi:hypothetical protein